MSEENLERLTHEELIKAEKLYTGVMRLSKRDMPYVNRNTPTVFVVSKGMPKAGTLTISFNNFDKLTPTDLKALTGEIFDMVNGRIQEYLQKTKSKTTSKESAS